MESKHCFMKDVPLIAILILIVFYLDKIRLISILCVLAGTLLAIISIVAWALAIRSHIKSKEAVQPIVNDLSVLNETGIDDLFLILIAPSDTIRHPMWYSGIDVLLRKLNCLGKRFVVVEAKTVEEAKEYLCNLRFNNIFVFGHGKRDRLGFYQSGCSSSFKYSTLRSCPRKDFIAQLTCNNGNGCSLLDILVKEDKTDDSFISDFWRTPVDNLFDIHFTIKIP